MTLIFEDNRMFQEQPSFELLFAQLGLDNDEASIDHFIAQHQLPAEMRLIDAPFWTQAQSDFLRNRLRQDDDWAPFVDELNKQLHHDANQAS